MLLSCALSMHCMCCFLGRHHIFHQEKAYACSQDAHLWACLDQEATGRKKARKGGSEQRAAAHAENSTSQVRGAAMQKSPSHHEKLADF